MSTNFEQLQSIFNNIEHIDGEREAWKKMFDLQTKLVVGLELEKIKLEKEIKNLKKDLELYKDIVRLSDHLNKKSNKQ